MVLCSMLLSPLQQTNPMKIDISRRTAERLIYILIIIFLVIYGLKDSEVAARMIHAVSEAFTVILTS